MEPHGRAKKVLKFGPITPAHRKPPWPGYKQSLRFFTKLLAEHPLVGICRPSNPLPAETLKAAGHMGGSIYIRGHSAGSYAGMVWETILAEFPNIEGRTVLTAIAFPPALLTRSVLSYNRQVHLIHHADDRLCIWNPSRHDMRLLQQQRFKITHVTGWRAYLENAQHNYAHWTRVSLPEGCHDLADLERMPGVLPFEVYAQAPLRLLSWCSFELNHVAKRLLRDLVVMCEDPTTTTEKLVDRIARQNAKVHNAQHATQYLASLATVQIASRAQMPNYTTMVQHFLGTLQLPIAIYMLDYYLPMLSPTKDTTKQALPCKAQAQCENPGNPFSSSFYSKVVNLAIGKLGEDIMHSPSDTPAWRRWMFTSYWRAKHTITK